MGRHRLRTPGMRVRLPPVPLCFSARRGCWIDRGVTNPEGVVRFHGRALRLFLPCSLSYLVPSSNGQDSRLSTGRYGFDSRRDRRRSRRSVTPSSSGPGWLVLSQPTRVRIPPESPPSHTPHTSAYALARPTRGVPHRQPRSASAPASYAGRTGGGTRGCHSRLTSV